MYVSVRKNFCRVKESEAWIGHTWPQYTCGPMYALSFDTLVESCLPFRPSGVEYIDSTSCWKMSAAEIRHSYLHTSGSFWCIMSQQLNVIHIYLCLILIFRNAEIAKQRSCKTTQDWDSVGQNETLIILILGFHVSNKRFPACSFAVQPPLLGESEDINKGLPWGFKFRVRKMHVHDLRRSFSKSLMSSIGSRASSLTLATRSLSLLAKGDKGGHWTLNMDML